MMDIRSFNLFSIYYESNERVFEVDYEFDSAESSSLVRFGLIEFMDMWNRLFKRCTPQYIQANQVKLDAEISTVVWRLLIQRKQSRASLLAQDLFTKAYFNYN